MTFNELGLSQPILQALELKGYETPSPIQAQSIPTVLEGRDLLGIAQTGTGKTAAFMLPSIDNLVAADKRPQRKSCRMLVLAPTRELAGQIAASAKDYAHFSHLKIATCFGGTSVHRNRQELARGVDILVATPGRLVDLADQKALDLSSVEILVLDEADQMLDLGFIHALRAIVRMLPKQRQTLFFSATMPNAIRQLADQYLTNPAQVAVQPAATTADRVEQFVSFVNQDEKQTLLTLVLEEGFKSREMDRVLIFTRTKHGADRVVKKLEQTGIDANAIHGNKSQPQRERALGAFRSGKVKVLVATDIAARGIDVSGVSHVINFELPNVAEQYVHRIGRTARAGSAGVAISFCAGDERDYLRDIQKLTKVTLDKVPLPEGFRTYVEHVEKEVRGKPQRAKVTPTGNRQRRGGGNRQGGEGRGQDDRPQRAARPDDRRERSDRGGNGGANGNRSDRPAHGGNRSEDGRGNAGRPPRSGKPGGGNRGGGAGGGNRRGGGGAGGGGGGRGQRGGRPASAGQAS